jgi:MFS transporter, SHS family, lactate transporter
VSRKVSCWRAFSAGPSNFDFILLVFAEEFGTEISNVTVAILLTLAMRPLGPFLLGRAADR